MNVHGSADGLIQRVTQEDVVDAVGVFREKRPIFRALTVDEQRQRTS